MTDTSGAFDTMATGGELAAPVSLDIRQRPRPLTQFGSGLVLDYDDTGSTAGAAANRAIIQSAFDSGEPELIIPRWLAIDEPIVHKYDQRIKGVGGSRSGLVGVGFGGAGNILKVRPAVFGLPYKQADKRQWGWENFGFKMHGGDLCAIPFLLDTTGSEPSVFLSKPRIIGLVIDGGISTSGRSIVHDNTTGHPTGGMFGALWLHNWLGDGVSAVNTGDSNNFIGNIVTGNGIGFYVSPIPGAAKNIFALNNITSSGGAIHVQGGTQTAIIKNQTEQNVDYTGPIAIDYGGSNFGAGIFVSAQSRDTIVDGNNANGYGRVIPIYDQGINTMIDMNTCEVTNAMVPHIRCDGSGWSIRRNFSSATLRYQVVNPASGYMEEVSDVFSATLTGVAGTVVGSVGYRRHGRTVTLSIPSIQGTSNSIVSTLTGLSAIVRPATTKTCLARITNNGTIGMGYVDIAPSGVITLHKDAANGAFATSGIKGIASGEISYAI